MTSSLEENNINDEIYSDTSALIWYNCCEQIWDQVDSQIQDQVGIQTQTLIRDQMENE